MGELWLVGMRPLSALDLVPCLAHVLSALKVPVVVPKLGCSRLHVCTVGVSHLHHCTVLSSKLRAAGSCSGSVPCLSDQLLFCHAPISKPPGCSLMQAYRRQLEQRGGSVACSSQVIGGHLTGELQDFR